MANSLVPQLDVHLGFETFGILGRFHLVRIEDEHSTFSLSPNYESTIFFYKASFVVETNLHALLKDLADRDQCFSYCRYMQDVFDASLFTFFPGWDIADVPNEMCGVDSRLYLSWVDPTFLSHETTLGVMSCMM